MPSSLYYTFCFVVITNCNAQDANLRMGKLEFDRNYEKVNFSLQIEMTTELPDYRKYDNVRRFKYATDLEQDAAMVRGENQKGQRIGKIVHDVEQLKRIADKVEHEIDRFYEDFPHKMRHTQNNENYNMLYPQDTESQVGQGDISLTVKDPVRNSKYVIDGVTSTNDILRTQFVHTDTFNEELKPSDSIDKFEQKMATDGNNVKLKLGTDDFISIAVKPLQVLTSRIQGETVNTKRIDDFTPIYSKPLNVSSEMNAEKINSRYDRPLQSTTETDGKKVNTKNVDNFTSTDRKPMHKYSEIYMEKINPKYVDTMKITSKIDGEKVNIKNMDDFTSIDSKTLNVSSDINPKKINSRYVKPLQVPSSKIHGLRVNLKGINDFTPIDRKPMYASSDISPEKVNSAYIHTSSIYSPKIQNPTENPLLKLLYKQRHFSKKYRQKLPYGGTMQYSFHEYAMMPQSGEINRNKITTRAYMRAEDVKPTKRLPIAADYAEWSSENENSIANFQDSDSKDSPRANDYFTAETTKGNTNQLTVDENGRILELSPDKSMYTSTSTKNTFIMKTEPMHALVSSIYKSPSTNPQLLTTTQIIKPTASSIQPVSFIQSYKPNALSIQPVTFTQSSHWPTFKEMLELVGKKYDWKNDRWIKVKRKAKSTTKLFRRNDIVDKHKFSYSIVKLKNHKGSKNAVIAVSAVR